MLAKNVKSIPHEYEELKNYSYLCYFDSKVNKINDNFIEKSINKFFIKQNYALLTRQHWYINNNIWDEYNECLQQERYSLESDKYFKYINDQLNSGLKEITENHSATGLLIRNMKHEKIIELNNTWYKHIQQCGIECQISFFFVKQLFDRYIHTFNENFFSNVCNETYEWCWS